MRGTTTSLTTTRAANERIPLKSAYAGDAVLRTSTRGTVHMGTVRWATEDIISQCPFLQMTYTAENPHADGSASSGARPRYRQPRHSDLPDTSLTTRHSPQGAAPLHGKGGQRRRRTATQRHTACCGPCPAPATDLPADADPHDTSPSHKKGVARIQQVTCTRVKCDLMDIKRWGGNVYFNFKSPRQKNPRSYNMGCRILN